MAKIDAGTVTVTSAGTAVQISTSIASGARVRASEKIAVLEVTPRATNTGDAMYLGSSNVSTTYGVRIPKGSSKSISLTGILGLTEGTGRDAFNQFYMDADSPGDKADWVVVW